MFFSPVNLFCFGLPLKISPFLKNFKFKFRITVNKNVCFLFCLKKKIKINKLQIINACVVFKFYFLFYEYFNKKHKN